MRHEPWLLVLFGLLVVAALLGCRYGFRYWQCSDVGAESNKPTKYSVISGCYVQVDGKWLPAERWRGGE